MPYYTKIYTQQSPNSIYQIIDERIILIPGGPIIKEFNNSITVIFDTINFYTNSSSRQEHVELLKNFCIIYSFLFNESTIQMFHNGEFTYHLEIESYTDVPINHESVWDKVDFNNVIEKAYFMNKPNGKFSLKEFYISTENSFIPYIILYLNSLENVNFLSQKNPEYKVFDNSYLRIVNYITILETIIGHDDYCNEEVGECKSCGKKGIKHRKGTENSWLKAYLKKTVNNDVIEESYFKVIDFARNIRNKTTHIGLLPTSKTILLGTSYEEYGFERSKNEYKDVDAALASIIFSLREITHFLLLNKFYKLNQFFPLQTLKVVRIKS
jgi:hypothetical protein